MIGCIQTIPFVDSNFKKKKGRNKKQRKQGDRDEYQPKWASPFVTQRSRIQLSMQETRVRSLGQEDPLERVMTTHSSILAWEIPWTEESGGL